jgi:flagellar basal-body rod protein FlgC
MGLLRSLQISGSALLAQRLRMDVVANNVANMNTSRTAEGGPYKRQSVRFQEDQPDSPFRDILGRAADAATGGGVHVSRIVEDDAAPRRVHDPQHPDADANGDVLLPNIDVVTEMTDVVSARRAYEASVTVLNATKAMAMRALDIGRGG